MIWLVLLSVLLPAATLRADILEWRDGSGVRHYTNLRAEIPLPYRDQAQKVIDETVRHPAVADETLQAAVQEETTPPRVTPAGVATLADAYVAGLERGLRLRDDREYTGRAAEPVLVNVPVSVPAAPTVTYVLPPYYGQRYIPWVTSSFDHGRSRHRTLRMVMENERLPDRDLVWEPWQGGWPMVPVHSLPTRPCRGRGCTASGAFR